MQRCRGLIEESEADGLPGSDGTMVLPSSWLVCSRLSGCDAVPSCNMAESFSWTNLSQRERKKKQRCFCLRLPKLPLTRRFLKPRLDGAETLPVSRCPSDTRKQRQRAGFGTSCHSEV